MEAIESFRQVSLQSGNFARVTYLLCSFEQLRVVNGTCQARIPVTSKLTDETVNLYNYRCYKRTERPSFKIKVVYKY